MSDSVRAAVLTDVGRLDVRDFPRPAVEADGGLLRIQATGVCGSDVHAYQHGFDLYEVPCVLGHEMIGVVEEIGDRAAERWGVEVGQMVAVEEYLPCGTCRACLAGSYQMCMDTRYGGKNTADEPGLWGGYADLVYLHPQSIVHPLPDESVSAELYQLYIPVSNGLYWVPEAGDMAIGDTVVIMGPGPHGLGCVVGAREGGAGKVVVMGTSRDAARLQVARNLGADEVVVVDEDDPVAAMHDITGGRLAQVVVNAASAAPALATALDIVADEGTVVQAGLSDGTTPVGPTVFPDKNCVLRGVRGRPSRLVPPALALIASGRYPLEELCTHRFNVTDTEGALQLVGAGGDGVIRASIGPDF